MRVLSLDGGGVRGIIQARILAELESISGKPCHELFDLIVGTSVGGIIAMALANGTSAIDLITFFQTKSSTIFQKSIFQSVTGLFGLLRSKYPRTGLDSVAVELFGQTLLRDAKVPVAVAAYHLNTARAHIFTSRLTAVQDYLMSDVAGATASAPTYFPPKQIGYNLFADGGLILNNPLELGILEANHISPGIKKEDINLLSIGTGMVPPDKVVLNNAGMEGWVIYADLVNLILDASSLWSTDDTAILYPNMDRLDVSLPKANATLDDASPDNLQALLSLTEKWVAENNQLLVSINASLQK
jgi:uncharacterized protein